VRAVIASNIADGYTPSRFAGVTQDGTAPNLVDVCSKLINDPATLEWLENELRKRPTLLTTEDFVCRHGANWGFNQATIKAACARVTYFDQVAGNKRYI
jgi:hypothetical protein